MPASVLQARFGGSLLGTMVGDQLGAPFEGQPSEVVTERLNPNVASASEWIQRSRYTDDTQMMIGVAETLVDCGRIDPAHLARRFAANYEPYRGYGAGAHQVLSALQQGVPWDRAATLVFPEGSFGNGAAMRVASVGLFYHNDLAELRQAAEGSAAVTHAHPLGREGAALQACAVALAVRSEPGSLNPTGFLRELRDFLQLGVDEYAAKLTRMAELLRGVPDTDEVIRSLGHDIRAHGSVPTAIYAFLSHHESFADAVIYAVRLGGDTDTIAAMTGAMAGAYHGEHAIPESWLAHLENSEKGRDYVRDLSDRLIERYAAISARTRRGSGLT